MIFLAQIIGVFAISLWVIALQNKERKNILKLQTIANLLYSIEYALLNAFVASSMNIISTLRCLIFSKKESKETKKYLYFFISLIIILAIFTYNGPLSLIPIIITLVYTISSYTKDTKYNRLSVTISAFIWIYYNYKVGAYITIIGNVLEIISGTMSLIRFRKDKL